MVKPKMIILVGNIGSGKSTYCKHLVKKGYKILSRDALRYMIGNGKYTFNLDIEPALRDAFNHLVERFCKHGVKIVIDETNVSVESRMDYLASGWCYDYSVEAHLLPPVCKEISVDRRMANPHGQNDRAVWESVYEKFDSIYEEPTLEEGFDAILEVGDDLNESE